MKNLAIGITVLLAVLAVHVSAQPNMLPLGTITVVTNAAAQSTSVATNAYVLNGWLDAIVLDLTYSYSSPTVTVQVVTAPLTGRPSRTLLSTSTVTADGELYPSVLRDTTAGVDITGAAARIPLVGDKLVFKVYGANAGTNVITCTGWAITSPVP